MKKQLFIFLLELYKKILSWLSQIKTDKFLHFIAGMIIAAFVALVIPTGRLWCFLPVVVIGFAKEVYDEINYGGFDWLDLAYTIAGGLIIQIFAWI